MNKPECKLIGTDGNIFALVGKASRALRNAGQGEEAKKMQAEVRSSPSYDAALAVLMNYVEVT